MKIPHIKYIEALVCSKFTAEQVHTKLEEYEFLPSFDGVNQVHATLAQINPEYIVNNEPDPNWLMELGVDKMVSHLRKLDMPRGRAGIDGAFRLLEDPLMYRLITSLALAGITDEDIELIVNGKFNINYTSEDITEFLHYFFNVKAWSLTDKLDFVEDTTNANLREFYKIALKGDKDYLVWKLGAAPNKTFDSMLRDIMTDSYYNFKERSRTDSDTAQKWGTLALKTVEKLEKLDKDTKDKKDVFTEITFKLSESREEAQSEVSNESEEGPLVKKDTKIKHISELDNE